jgi:CheY-like chemotaxis protein
MFPSGKACARFIIMPRDTIQNILLVEDEIIIAMAGQRMLENNGYNVMIAMSGEESVRIMNSGADIDIIIMDIDLGKGMTDRGR